MISARLRLIAVAALCACANDGTGAGDVLVVSDIDIVPPGAGLVVGGTQQFTATPKTSSGIPVPNRPVSWSTSDAGIATVSGSGLVTAIALGEATISARVDQTTASVPVNVSPQPVASVVVEPAAPSIKVGESVQLIAIPRDAQGEPLTDRTVAFLSDNPAIASVSTTGVVVGIAVGSTILRARSEGKEGTSTVTVTPRPAARLGFITQPADATAGTPLGAVRVAVQDDIGGTVSGASSPVTIALSDNSGNATLAGTLTVNAVAGVASFENLVLTRAGSGYTLRATSDPLSPAVSNPFAIAAGAASQLAVTTQPSASAKSGLALAQQPVLQLQDANGNSVAQTGVQITVSLVGSGANLTGTLTAPTTAAGAAGFTDLAIVGAAGTYQLHFTATALASVTSTDVVLATSALVIMTQPSANATNGVVLPQQPVVRLVDQAGLPLSQPGIPVTATLEGTGAVLGGALSVNTNSSGIAPFTGLTITGTAGSFRLVFASPVTGSVTSAPIQLRAGPATKLMLAVQPPATAQSGTPFVPQPEVQLADQSGNPVATAGVAVTAQLASGPGTLAGGPTVSTNASGRAAFTNLRITGPSGSYTIRFNAPSLTSVVSDPVVLGAGAATQLAIDTQPSSTAASGVPFAQQPKVQMRDGANNAVAVAGVAVTATIATGGGTLVGTATVTTDANGLASFTNLGISGIVGNRTLQFATGALTPAVSNTISITPGAPARLALTVQPSPTAMSGTPLVQQPVVQIQDGAGNNVSQSGTAITASVESGAGGTLGGGTVAVSNGSGQAAFTTLQLTGASGNYTLRFTGGGLTPIVSGTIVLGAGAGSKLGIATPVSSSVKNGVQFPQQPVIQLLDASNNPVAQAGVPVTVTILSGAPALSGTRPIPTDAAGKAAFTDLAITGLVGDRVLIFAAPSYASITSGTISVTAGDPAALKFTTAPGSTAQSGVALSPQPAVHLEDHSGNAVSQAGIQVTASLASGSGSVANATATTNSSGVATFSALTITGATGTKTLGFGATGLSGTTSGAINVSAGPAAQLSITTQPGGAATGQALAPQPQIQLRDGAGNPISQAGVTVTASIATSPGGSPSLANANATTDANGLATFSGLAITGPTGGYTLRFESNGLASVLSGQITLAAGAPATIDVEVQPPNAAQSGQTFGADPQVRVFDGASNPVGDATVTVQLNGGNGTLQGVSSHTTAPDGRVTFGGLSIVGLVGSYALEFQAGSAAATSASITLSAGPAALIAANSSLSQSATVGTAVGASPSVLVTDGGGNPVSGVSVTFAVTAGGGGIDPADGIATTNSSGVATLNSWTLGTTAGNSNNTVTATASGLGGSPVTFSATAAPGDAAQLAITAQPAGAVKSGDGLGSPAVEVRDGFGNLVAATNVTVGLEIVAAPDGTLNGTTTVATVAGVATFSGLSITSTGGVFKLRFDVGALNISSNDIVVSP